MASRTLLQIVNDAQNELGLPASSSVIGNTTDASAVQMLAIMQAALSDIRHEALWSFLQTQFNLVVSTPITTYTGNTTLNSPTLSSMSSVSGITAPYWIVQGTGIPVDARITAVGASTLTMNMQATSNNTATTFTFAQDTYALPSDFDYMQSRTWWDRTNRWELLGPDSPQLDQWHRSGIVTTGPRRHWRIVGANANTLRFWPPPAEIANPIQTVFEYISTNTVYVTGPGGTTLASVFANDSDTSVFASRLLTLYLKMQYWKIKGFGDLFGDEYRAYLDRLIAQDGGNMTLNITKRVNPVFVSPANVQDGFFPGPIGPNTG